MDNKCPVCGAPYMPGVKFCQECGAKLPEAAPAQAEVQYEAPAAPAAEVPAAPVPPAAPAYEAPAAPAAPVYEAPAAPAYTAPAAPAYEAPAYAAPVPPAAPVYAAPTPPAYPAPAYAPAAPAPKKKKKTGLIVTLCVIAVLIAAAVLAYFFLLTPSSVDLSESKITVMAGDETPFELTAEIAPGSALLFKDVTWKSSDTKIAKVSQDGKVTGVSVGSCKITATVSGFLIGEKQATCTVEVQAAPEDMYMSESSVKLQNGDELVLELYIFPIEAEDAKIEWASNDPTIATVEQGKVVAVSEGTCTITATAPNGVTATCTVTVAPEEVEVESVTLSKKQLELKVDETETLTAKISPKDATDQTITWTSSDPWVATVDDDGTVTATGKGTCEITATAANGESASCSVKVTEDVAVSDYDKYILGEWRLTLVYDWNTDIDSPASEYGASGKITFYSDHTASMVLNTESSDDLTWQFEEVDSNYGDYFFLLDDGEEMIEFRYVIDNGEIWLYLDDAEITLTFER